MDNKYSALIGRRLQTIRKQHSLTQEQLSSQLQVMGCDLPRSAIAKIEVGQRHIYPDELKAIHLTLRIPYEELLP